MASLRERALRTGNCRIAKVEVDFDGSGEKLIIGVRQPSLAVRRKLFKITHGNMTPEAQELQDAQTVIECACYAEDCADDDGTQHHRGDPLFTQHDIDGLKKQPVPWVAMVAREAGLLMVAGPAPAKCLAHVKDENGKEKKGNDGQPLVCGSELRPYYKFCPMCGEAMPDPLETARGN